MKTREVRITSDNWNKLSFYQKFNLLHKAEFDFTDPTYKISEYLDEYSLELVFQQRVKDEA